MRRARVWRSTTAKVSVPTLANELAQRKEEEAIVAKLQAALAVEKDESVAEDLQILIDSEKLGFRTQDYTLSHRVPFSNATMYVYGGLQTLLDDQLPQSRREAAVARLKAYAGLTPGYRPLTEILLERDQGADGQAGDDLSRQRTAWRRS